MNTIGNATQNPPKFIHAESLSATARNLRGRRGGELVTFDGLPCVKIPLTRGRFALVDYADGHRALAINWRYLLQKGINRNGEYAVSTQVSNGRRKYLAMHRWLTGALVDHKNGNGLDNRRCNLRVATHQQNCCNQRRKVGKSGFIGVLRVTVRGKAMFAARIKHYGKRIFLKNYDSPKEAAMAYDAKAIELRGEFAVLNFPIDTALKVSTEGGGQ